MKKCILIDDLIFMMEGFSSVYFCVDDYRYYFFYEKGKKMRRLPEIAFDAKMTLEIYKEQGFLNI